jgi:hypothetical protein
LGVFEDVQVRADALGVQVTGPMPLEQATMPKGYYVTCLLFIFLFRSKIKEMVGER